MKLKALVVDDSKVMRNLVKQSLVKSALAEFEFTEAEDGEEALERYKTEPVDMVFADWNMPKLSGLALAKELRAMETERRVPIVMVTSERSLGKVEQALETAGVDAYVCKPFTVEELKTRIGKLIDALEHRGPAEKQSGGFFKKLLT